MNKKSYFMLFLLLNFFIAFPAFATFHLNEAVEPSINLFAQGLGEIVEGSNHIFISGRELMITAITEKDNNTYLSLRNKTDSTAVTIKLSANIANDASLSTGQSIKINSMESGYALLSAGKIFAFIPNQLGSTLIYNHLYTQG